MESVHENYRDILRHELDKRIQKNPRYSVRAFAKFLGLDSRHLAGVLKGIKGLSVEKSQYVVERLGCATHVKEFFLESVRAEDGRGRSERARAKKQLDALLGKGILRKMQVELDQVELVSDWIGIALHEYIKSHPHTTGLQLIRAFGETKERVSAALECLESLKLISKSNGKYTAQDVNVFSSDEIPSQAVRNGHRSLLKRAEQSLEQDPMEQRDFFSLILSVDPQDLPEAKRFVRQFLNQFNHRFSKEVQTSEVMSLAMQLVPLSKTKLSQPKGETK